VPETVTLVLPADTGYVSLARSVAASMAARADLTVDHLEDVRLAVDEAVSQLIHDSADGTVSVSFALHADGLAIEVSARTKTMETPAQDTFSWTVLTALVDDVTAVALDGVVTIALRMSRRQDA
jgi:serine/threonine-protein kinase RsbW